MFALKLIGKILLLPVWLILLLVWGVVHVAVSIFSLFYGFWKLFWTAVIILSLCFGLWQNALLMGVFIAAVFLILFAGSFVDVLLETARKGVGQVILS